MICFPNAKINLGLSVLEKRKDGFHNIETILYPIKLKDVLEIIISPDHKFSFTNTGLQVAIKPENNLVIRAFELLKKDFQLEPVEIHLHKIIPFGAGLGGGSSDAAFTIKLLNDLFNIKLSVSQKLGYARQLGSDCAFFIENKPAVAIHKGDELETIGLDLENYFFLIVKPDIQIPTSEAYSWVHPVRNNLPLMKIVHQPVEQWKKILKNDFEPAIFDRFPAIKEIKNELYKLNAIYASMSGSGSAVYGIFKDKPALSMSFKNHFVWKNF